MESLLRGVREQIGREEKCKMPKKRTSARSFNYDISSLLAYPPPPLSEVVMTISGMTGENWNGMGNGSHDLDGSETIKTWASVGGDHWEASHKWSYGGSKLYLTHEIQGPFGSPTSSWERWELSYNGSNDVSHSFGDYGTTVASIGAFCFSSTTISGVTFTWSQGTDWSRGDM